MSPQSDLDQILVNLDNDAAWPDDPNELYDAIVHAACVASQATQSGAAATFASVDDVLEKLARIARRLGDRLRKAAAGIGASSCSVAVAWPPGISVTLNWDTASP